MLSPFAVSEQGSPCLMKGEMKLAKPPIEFIKERLTSKGNSSFH